MGLIQSDRKEFNWLRLSVQREERLMWSLPVQKCFRDVEQFALRQIYESAQDIICLE